MVNPSGSTPKARKAARQHLIAKKQHSTKPTSRLDEFRIARMRAWTPERAAMALDGRAREICDSHCEDFTELGLIVQEVRSRELWTKVVSNDGQTFYHSFDQWMNEALWCSARWGYAALSVAETCSDIPVETRQKIPPKNLMTLRKVSPSVRRDPAVQKRAIEKKPKEFVQEISEAHPYQHIEEDAPYRFSPSKSQREKIDEAMILCLKLENLHSREEVLEFWAQEYIQENVYRTSEQRVVGKVKGAKAPAVVM